MAVLILRQIGVRTCAATPVLINGPIPTCVEVNGLNLRGRHIGVVVKIQQEGDTGSGVPSCLFQITSDAFRLDPNAAATNIVDFRRCPFEVFGEVLAQPLNELP